MNIENLEKGIEKTGYRLEFDISSTLVHNGWNVINNKYYVDDQQETVREIDIVAYRVRELHGVYVYTALIISCKKSEENAWALLSKKSDPKDPNTEWLPVHAWSNDKILEHMLDKSEWKKSYLRIAKNNGCHIVSSIPDRHIFAFQEMKKESGNPQNDKNIFNSITSLMKAQAYEMNALPLRKKNPCVFQFNLLSVMKTDLVRLDFESEGVKATAIDQETYVAGYIVDKQQTFAKIQFIQSDHFDNALKRYNKLHESNIEAFGVLIDKFYGSISSDHEKLNLFRDEVSDDIWWSICKTLGNFNSGRKIVLEGSLWWSKPEELIEFQLAFDEEKIDRLNSSSNTVAELSKSLKAHYNYVGECRFATDDIPF